MPHLFLCHQCRTRAPEPRGRREDAETDRQGHRDAAHGGHGPVEGDEIRRVHADARGDGILPRHTWVAALFLLALILANCGHH